MIKKLLFLGLLSCGAINVQAVVAVGDTPDSPTTFQFSVGPVIYNPAGPQLWTLSAQELPYPAYSSTVRSYGIAYTTFIPVDASLKLTLTALPYLTSQAIITTTNSEGTINVPGAPVDNPLLGQAFSGVTFVGSAVTMVNALSQQYVYMIQAQSVAFYDSAAGKYSPEGICTINQLDLGVGQQAKMIAGSGAAVLFVAQAQGATFGTDSSEIAFATSQITSPAGQNTSYTTLVNQAATAVAVSTPALIAGGNDLDSIGSSVAMYPSPTTAYQMYVGLDVTAAAALGSQAVGLCTATSIFKTDATPASLLFGSIVPDEVASAGLDTPVSASRGNRVAVRNISSTTTSTGLSYLINSYTNGTGRQFVYAMPMVTMDSTGVNNGKIANFDPVSPYGIAQVFKISGTTYRTQGFDTLITDAAQIDINSTDPAVIARMQVGGGAVPLPAGQYIDQLMALGDAVYISIQQPFGTDATPGMFKSQALVDAQGRIMSWSPWQRVAGTDDQILFAALNKDTDATMFVSGADSNTVQQTVWNSTTDLTSCIAATNSAMPLPNGGVQGLLAVSNKTVDLSEFSIVVTTGNAGVVITQTGSLDGDGNMVIDSPQNTVTLNSSLGLQIGSVVAATFANNSDSDDNWFFMGGDSGLSVLSDDTTGFAFNGELLSLDTLIATGMSCKTLGSFSFVKKLVSSDDYLYILTQSAVYRIALDAAKFRLISPTDLNPELVVSASTIDRFASCTDMIVDNDVMLLGTTAGLYSLDLSGALPAISTSIEIPGGLSSVSRLFTISNHPNYYQNFYDSSNLYVLTINYVVQQARLNRFTITNGVVAPIQDQLLQGQNGPLLIFSYMSNNIFIDGSLGFATSYRMGKLAPTIKYLESSLQGGKSSTHVSLKKNTADLSIKAVVNSLGITAIARDYASGCLVLAADFGILTNS